MFRIIGRIIRWIGPRKSKICWGFVFSFIQALFTAMPVMAAAYAINLVLEQTKGGPTVQTTQIFLITAFIILSILGRFWFSYLKARYLNGVGYETAQKGFSWLLSKQQHRRADQCRHNGFILF